jgi:chromosome segregation ATPase
MLKMEDIKTADATLDEALKQVEYHKNEAKQAFEKRQEIRAELESLKLEKEQIEKTKLEEQQKYKELYEKANSELETYKPYADKVKDYETKFAVIQEQRKTEILSKLPENLRLTLAKIDNVDLLSEQVNAIIETMPNKFGVDTTKAGKGYSENIQDVTKITAKQLEEIKGSNPKRYNEIIKQLI